MFRSDKSVTDQERINKETRDWSSSAADDQARAKPQNQLGANNTGSHMAKSRNWRKNYINGEAEHHNNKNLGWLEHGKVMIMYNTELYNILKSSFNLRFELIRLFYCLEAKSIKSTTAKHVL